MLMFAKLKASFTDHDVLEDSIVNPIQNMNTQFNTLAIANQLAHSTHSRPELTTSAKITLKPLGKTERKSRHAEAKQVTSRVRPKLKPMVESLSGARVGRRDFGSE